MIRTPTPLMLAALLAFAAPVAAQMYTWKDEQGRTVMSDKKPSGKVRGERVIKSGPDSAADAAAAPAAPAPKPAASGVDPELEKRRQAAEDKAKAEAAALQREREREEKQRMDAACKSMRQSLALLDTGVAIARPDGKGGINHLSDAEVKAEREQLRKQINDNCN